MIFSDKNLPEDIIEIYTDNKKKFNEHISSIVLAEQECKKKGESKFLCRSNYCYIYYE